MTWLTKRQWLTPLTPTHPKSPNSPTLTNSPIFPQLTQFNKLNQITQLFWLLGKLLSKLKPLELDISTFSTTNQKKRKKSNPSWRETLKFSSSDMYFFNRVCVWLKFVCLYIHIDWKDNFFMNLSRFSLHRHRLPSSTSAAELGTAVVIQLLLLEAGPNNSLQTLWNRFDSIDVTLACEDIWGRCQPGPSNTREFTMHSFEDTSKQWRLHWCAPGLQR